MAEKDIGSLVVMDGDELVGIITERHYARNVVLKGKTSPTTPVRDPGFGSFVDPVAQRGPVCYTVKLPWASERSGSCSWL